MKKTIKKTTIKKLSILIALITLIILFPALSFNIKDFSIDNLIQDFNIGKYNAPVDEPLSTEITFDAQPLTYRYVGYDNVNLYSTPNEEGEILETLNFADFIAIESANSDTLGWVYVNHNGTKGYILENFTSSDFLYKPDYGTVYIKEDSKAYIQPNLKSESINLNFNQDILQIYSNEQWSICNINDVAYFIPKNNVSNIICFKEDNRTVYIKNEDTIVYTTPDEIFTSDLMFDYDEKLEIIQSNKDWLQFEYNDNYYYIKQEDAANYKDLSDSECKDKLFNQTYDNTEIINRLNTLQNDEISQNFVIGNKELRELVNSYLDKAKETAGPEASPAEIVYYAYLDLMDNAIYRYNTYGYAVKKEFKLKSTPNRGTGSYRAASILSRSDNLHRGACENYAAAMTAFLRTMGFDAEVVGGDGAGTGSSGHYWCQVGDLVFDAQIDDQYGSYGLRFGRTSDEIEALGHSGYYVEETSENDTIVETYNVFDNIV